VSSAKAENLGTELAKLTDPQRRAASERFRVIWPFLEGGVPLKQLAEKHGKSVRTLRYWVALYRKGDILALAPKPRSDRGLYDRSDPCLRIGHLATTMPDPGVPTSHRRSRRTEDPLRHLGHYSGFCASHYASVTNRGASLR
jgi:transposase-like protein